jgi:hypothetical protein
MARMLMTIMATRAVTTRTISPKPYTFFLPLATCATDILSVSTDYRIGTMLFWRAHTVTPKAPVAQLDHVRILPS